MLLRTLPFFGFVVALAACHSPRTNYDGEFGFGGQPFGGQAATSGATNTGGASGNPSTGGTTAQAGSSGGVQGVAGTPVVAGGSGGSSTGGATSPSGGNSGGSAASAGSNVGGGSAGAPMACKTGTPTPASGGANFPFPQRRFYSSCLHPTTCLQEDIQVGWENYKAKFIVDGGNGTLRVQRTEFNNDTVSEGIAYGMLFAVYMNEKDIFDKIWKYAESKFDGNGLMHWKIRPDGSVEGSNSATDSDEDMAFALVMADKQWGGYTEVAKSFLNKVAEHDFHDDGTIRGGDSYDAVNPSYLAPAFYRTFANYTGDSRWTTILNKSYDILEGAANDTTGLVPDWTDGRGNDYLYDAARTPYRVALDACWNDEPRAKAYGQKIGAFFAGIGVANIRSGYRLDGTSIGEHHNSTFVGPAGSAGMVSNSAQLVQESYDFVIKDLRAGEENYYNMSWALFTAMLMTGNFDDLTKTR